MFSPYYAAARRRGPTTAEQHCAVNVVLHEGNRQRWAMTERGAVSMSRRRERLDIGRSSLEWNGTSLRYRVDEVTFPWPGRIRGEITFTPGGGGAGEHALDTAGRHRWLPLAPRGRVQVDLDAPRMRWSGAGYFDHNRGSEPLERAFHHWSWSRWAGSRGTLLHYDACRRGSDPLALHLAHCPERGFRTLPPIGHEPLRHSRWRIARSAPADSGTTPRVMRTLLDSPFYARSLLESTLQGERLTGFHESLSLDRFDTRWVQALLPFRMPRRNLAPRG